MKICILVVYFGKLPNYFKLWIQSIEYNSEINFIFFTDNEIENAPSNLKVIKTNILTLKNIVINKLCIKNISLETAYKFCDFKPAYGVIFSEYITGYDYWGYCDLDMIFGDITEFINLYHIEYYDKFLDKGHLSFYRNTDRVNNAFKLDGATYSNRNISYVEVFTSNRNWIFDETNGIDKIFLNNGLSLFENTVYCDVLCLHKRLQLWNLPNFKNQCFYWKKGKIFRIYWEQGCEAIEEFMYIHMQKRRFDILGLDECIANNAYYICPDSFIPMKRVTELKDVKKYNRYKGEFIEKADYCIRKNNYMISVYKKSALRRIKNQMKTRKFRNEIK